MKFGTKKSDVVEVDSGEFKPYLRSFKAGDNVVRFIDEVDDWIQFWEHFTTEGKSFPCTGDRDSCPGCTSEVERTRKASRKYATNLQLVQNGMVLPFRIPITLAKKLFNRAERNGSITNRDYIVMRDGQGMDTEYDLEQDEKRPVDLDALRAQAMDLQEVFQSVYDELWGDSSEKDEKPAKKSLEGEGTPPFDESEVLDEDDLRSMSRKKLAKLAKKHGIVFSEDDDKQAVLEAILAQAE